MYNWASGIIMNEHHMISFRDVMLFNADDAGSAVSFTFAFFFLALLICHRDR